MDKRMNKLLTHGATGWVGMLVGFGGGMLAINFIQPSWMQNIVVVPLVLLVLTSGVLAAAQIARIIPRPPKRGGS